MIGYRDGYEGREQADYASDEYYDGYDRGVESRYIEDDHMASLEVDFEETDGPLY